MSDKKQPEESLKSAKSEKVLTEAEKAEKGREALARYMSWVMPLQAKGRHAFRGQADAKWGVTSGAHRRLEKEMRESPYAAESLFVGYLHERINEAHMRFSGHGGKYPLEVMAQLQHYGAATGLIDFTESALAALWFACKDEQNELGKVFAVCLDDPQKIKEIKTRDGIKGELDKFFPTEISDKLQVWRPGDGNSRMVTQQSLFLFGRPKIGEDFFAKPLFEVAADEKIPLMDILESMGVLETFMFSDFAGFAQANAHGKVYDLHRTKTYYDEKIADSEISDGKKRNLYFERGNLNQALKCYQEAVDDFTFVIDAAPSAEAHNNRGNALGDLGRHEEALADYTRAIELNPQHANAHYNRGNALGDLGRHEEALADYTRVIELNPQHTNAHYNRGVTLDDLGRHEEALADYTRVIELNPQHANAHYNRGVTLDDLGRHEEALADYTRAIEINPQYAKAHNNRGGALGNLGRHEEAVADYTRAIELNPQHANAHHNRGVALGNLGRHEEALADYTRAIEINPQYAKAHSNRGNALGNLGRHEEAVADYTRAIELNPQYAAAHNNRGAALDDLGRHEEAIADYTRAIEINPQYAAAYNNRGVALGNLGRHEEAIADWKEAMRIGKKTGDKEVIQKATANLAKHAKPK